jgi:Na+-driven multidrug efflux pump
MLDGVITDDSKPVASEEVEVASEPLTGVKKPSMSLRTSFGLSLKNLITKKGRTLLTAFAGSIGALSAIFSGPLSSIMSSNPEVIKYSQQKMVIISSTYFICGINNILSETMRGFRRPLIPTVATLLYMCLFRFAWVWWIFPLVPNLTFLYLVWPIGWILSIITVVAFLIPTMKNDNWKKRFIN